MPPAHVLGLAGELLLQGASSLFVVALDVTTRPTPDARDHALLFGAVADIEGLGLDAPHGPSDTHLVVVLPRAELVTTALRRWPAARLGVLAAAARADAVHVAILAGGRLAVAVLSIPKLYALAMAGPMPATMSSVTMREGVRAD